MASGSKPQQPSNDGYENRKSLVDMAIGIKMLVPKGLNNPDDKILKYELWYKTRVTGVDFTSYLCDKEFTYDGWISHLDDKSNIHGFAHDVIDVARFKIREAYQKLTTYVWTDGRYETQFFG